MNPQLLDSTLARLSHAGVAAACSRCEQEPETFKIFNTYYSGKRCIYFMSQPQTNEKIPRLWHSSHKERNAICSQYPGAADSFSLSFSLCFHLVLSEMSLVLTHVTIQIQFSVDISNAVHTLENVFAHTRAQLNSFKRETPPVGLITLMPALRQGAINHIFALG